MNPRGSRDELERLAGVRLERRHLSLFGKRVVVVIGAVEIPAFSTATGTHRLNDGGSCLQRVERVQVPQRMHLYRVPPAVLL